MKKEINKTKKYKIIMNYSLFTLLFLYDEIVLRLFNHTSSMTTFIYPFLFALSLGLLCTSITIPLNKTSKNIITSIILFITSLLFIIECIVYNTFSVYMTFHSLLSGFKGVATGYSNDFIHSITGNIKIIFIFLLPFILYLIFNKHLEYKIKTKRLKCGITFLLSICIFIVSIFTAGMNNAYKETYEFNNATKIFGLIASTRLSFIRNESSFNIEESTEEEKETKYAKNKMNIDFKSLAENESDEDIKSLDTYVSSLTPSSQNEYTGLFKGYNLILICAEAFSDKVIDKELTPTLYRMQHNGFDFTNYYQPTWGGSTSTGEYSFLTGLVPNDGVDTMLYTEGHNMYFTLGNQLQRLSYYSGCYHNGQYDFYSRNKTHTNLGYDYFLALGNGLEDITGQYPEDEKMISDTLDTYINKQPFSVYYMSVSGHCVYSKNSPKVKKNYKYVKSIVGDKYEEKTIYYLCYQYELEKAMTTLIKKLEDKGIAENTVICMTADHYPYGLAKSSTFGNNKNYVYDLYGKKYTTDKGRDHNSLIIWSGALEHKLKKYQCKITDPTYSLDVVPTLSNLFGLKYDSRLLVGRDVFSDTEPLVLWNDHSWITNKGYYDATENTFTPSKKGANVSDKYISKINKIVTNKINFSVQTLYTDYYASLFGKDTITNANSDYEKVWKNKKQKKKEEPYHSDEIFKYGEFIYYWLKQ